MEIYCDVHAQVRTFSTFPIKSGLQNNTPNVVADVYPAPHICFRLQSWHIKFIKHHIHVVHIIHKQ